MSRVPTQRLAATLLALAASIAVVCLEQALDRTWGQLGQRQQMLLDLQQFAATPANWPVLANAGNEIAFPNELGGLAVSWRREELGLVLSVAGASPARPGQRP